VTRERPDDLFFGAKTSLRASRRAIQLLQTPTVVVDETLSRKSRLKAVRFANAAAAICVTRLGAQPSIPSRQEIEQFLQETGEK